MNQTLRELRNDWEKTFRVMIVVPIMLPGFTKIFVITKEDRMNPLAPIFRLHRYFNAGVMWSVSIDAELPDMNTLLEKIQIDEDLLDLLAMVIDE